LGADGRIALLAGLAVRRGTRKANLIKVKKRSAEVQQEAHISFAVPFWRKYLGRRRTTATGPLAHV
jgi:hypothetical protein